MPPIRSTFSNRGNQRSGNGQNRSFGMQRQGRQQASPEFEITGYVPESNDSLRRTERSVSAQPFGEHIGVTAQSVELDGNKLRLSIEPNGEVIRDTDRVREAEQLLTREELREQSISSERRGNAVRIDGDISVDLATALSIVDGHGDNQRESVMMFRRPQIETIRGAAGPVGLLHGLPGEGIRQQIGEEHLIVVKKGGTEGYLSLEPTEEKRKASVYAAKERTLVPMRERLQALMMDPTKNKESIARLSDRIKRISKFRPVFAIREEKLPSDVKSHMQVIETDFAGHKEVIEGYTDFKPENRTLTIARQVRINPGAHGYKIQEIIDATGMERELRSVDTPERSMAGVVQAMVKDIRKPKTVQGPDKTLVRPEIVQARMLSDLYAVSPTFDYLRSGGE